MSILKKTIILVCLTSLFLLVLMYFISDYFYLKGFEDLEKQTVERNVRRVNETISDKLNAMSTFCYDWAAWDDTYNFAREFDQEYIDRNLHYDTFNNAKLNIIAILNNSGEIVFGKAYDFINDRETSLPENFTQAIIKQKTVSGIILASGQPMLIVSQPILTSLAEGPIAGTMVMGRFLDTEILDSLSAITSFPVTIVPVSEIGFDPVLKQVAPLINSSNPIYIQIQNKKMITGYSYIDDIAGNHILFFKVDRYRDIFNQGRSLIGIWHLSMLAVGIIFDILLILLVKKYFITRFNILNENMKKITASSDISIRIPVQGKDDLSRLTGSINAMLDSLERSEVRLRRQQEIIGYVVDNTPNAVLATEGDGQIVLANNAFKQMFGTKEKEIIGREFISLVRLGNLVPETKAFLDSGYLNNTKEFQYKYNGIKKTFIINFARLNEEKLFFMILTDITEEQARQERLYLTHRLASVGEMASGIAHELNNPLTGIIGLSELLMDEKVPDHVKEDLSAINSEAKRSATVIKNMLSFARKHSPTKQPAQINKVLEDVLALRRHEQKNHNIQVIKELSPDLPDITVDPFQMQQVFINIILNAEHAMMEAHGKGTLTIISEKVKNHIRISFTDDGPGIDPKNIHRIFDPFFTTKDVGKGTGLGLSICYGIISDHDGLIYAKNENGRGATFIIELPVK